MLHKIYFENFNFYTGENMDKKICFIGHRNVYKYGEIEKKTL